MYPIQSPATTASRPRRHRPALACLLCRRRKVKCDQKKPCSQCSRSPDIVCTYSSDPNLSASQSPSRGRYQEQRKEVQHYERQRYQQDPRNLDSFSIPTPENTVAGVSAAHSPHSTVSGRPSSLHGSSNSRAMGYPPAPIGPRTELSDGLFSLTSHILPDATSSQVSPRPSAQALTLHSPDVERHVLTRDAMPDVELGARAGSCKTKLFGEWYWMNDFGQFPRIRAFILENGRKSEFPGSDFEMPGLLHRCKTLGRTIKAEQSQHFRTAPDYQTTIPSKEVCDVLVGNYFRLFESVHRILHIPSFMCGYEQYWRGLGAGGDACSPYVVKLLVVLAIGVAVSNEHRTSPLRSAARQWVYAAQQWLSAPLEKSRMNVNGLQIGCLLQLARETVGIGADLLWTSASTLVGAAMQLGYHRDPKHFPGMSILHAEIRRRLWATIMEMALQASFDSAMPPRFSLDDFDTEAPANIDDADISKTTSTPPISHPLTTYTQTSLQILLLNSLPTRLAIGRFTADFRQTSPQSPTSSMSSYDTVLRLGTALTTAIRSSHSRTQASSFTTSTFRRNHLATLTQRPLLVLHRPWAISVRHDPRFYFSRKQSLDTALALVSLSPDTEWTHVLSVGHAVWREHTTLPATVVAMELMMQLDEEIEAQPSGPQAAMAKVGREPLLEIVRGGVDMYLQRIRESEVNVKGHIFTSMALGQIEAMERGESADEGVRRAAIESVRLCLGALEARVLESGGGEEVVVEGGGEGGGGPVVWEQERLGDAMNYDFLEDMGFDFDIEFGLV